MAHAIQHRDDALLLTFLLTRPRRLPHRFPHWSALCALGRLPVMRHRYVHSDLAQAAKCGPLVLGTPPSVPDRLIGNLACSYP